MGVCSNIKRFTRNHERLADLSSLMAVALLFGSIWVAIEFQGSIIDWVKPNILLNGALLALAVVADLLLIILLLSLGALRFSAEDEDGRCFQTFRGRRHGGASVGSAFRNWVHHMEHVGKKHR